MSDSPVDRYRQTLDLHPDASLNELKQAYRAMAKVWHPDRFPADSGLRETAEVRMKQINEAYAALLALHSVGPVSQPAERARQDDRPSVRMAATRTIRRSPRRRKRSTGPTRAAQGMKSRFATAVLCAAIVVAVMAGWATLYGLFAGRSPSADPAHTGMTEDRFGGGMGGSPSVLESPSRLPLPISNPTLGDDSRAGTGVFSPSGQSWNDGLYQQINANGAGGPP